MKNKNKPQSPDVGQGIPKAIEAISAPIPFGKWLHERGLSEEGMRRAARKFHIETLRGQIENPLTDKPTSEQVEEFERGLIKLKKKRSLWGSTWSP